MKEEFLADVIDEYIKRLGLSFAQIAKEARLHSRSTINNWVNGYTKKPRDWRDLVKVGLVLKLNKAEMNRLLASADHKPLDELRKGVEVKSDQVSDDKKAQVEADFSLLNHWMSDKTPNQLPRLADNFHGRNDELTQVLEHLRGERKACYLVGMSGVGKSVLANKVGNAVSGRYSDGVLWVQLGPSASLMTALYQIGEAYGKNISHLDSLEARSAEIRSLLSQKDALLILDNVVSGRDLDLLLPSSGSSILVTTQDETVCKPSKTVKIKPFNDEDSRYFLERYLEDRSESAKQEAISRIVRLLGGLPLALKIVGNRLRQSPHVTINEFADLLQDEVQRLTHLEDAKDANAIGVRATFGLSYVNLSKRLQFVFCALSAFADDGFTIPAVRALLNEQNTIAKLYLADLATVSLLEEIVYVDGKDSNAPSNLRYQFHTLVKRFASEKLEEAFSSRILGLRDRMAHYYIEFVNTHGAETYQAIDHEYVNILGVLEDRLATKQKVHSAALINGLSLINLGVVGYWDGRGAWQDAEQYFAQLAEFDMGDDERAMLCFKQGVFDFRRSQFDSALGKLEQGIALASTSLSAEEQAWFTAYTSEFLGRINLHSDLEAAMVHLQEGMAVLEMIPETVARQYQGYLGLISAEVWARYMNDTDRAHKVAQQGLERLGADVTHAHLTAYNNLGIISIMQGDLEESNRYFDEAIRLAEALGNQEKLAATLINRGINTQHRGELYLANLFYERALKIQQQIGDMHGEGRTLNNLAMIPMIWGNYEEALHLVEQSIAIAKRQGIATNEGFSRTTKGQILLRTEAYGFAEEELEKAHQLATQIARGTLLPSVLILQAELCLLLELYKAGLEKVKEVIQLKEGNEDQELGMAYTIKGRLLDELERCSEARDSHQKAVQILEGKDAYEYAVSQLFLLKHETLCLTKSDETMVDAKVLKEQLQDLEAVRERQLFDSLENK